MSKELAAGLVAVAAVATLVSLTVVRCSTQRSRAHAPSAAAESTQHGKTAENGGNQHARKQSSNRTSAAAASDAGPDAAPQFERRGPASSALASTPSARRRPCRIAAIGDSLTDKRSHGGGYLDVVQRSCPQSRIDNYGRGGDMVNQMRRRFFSQVVAPKAPQYSHVIVFGGVNDLYSDLTAGRTNDKIEQDLMAMYSAARQRGAKVVAITVTPWGGFSRYFNARRGEATRALNQWILGQAASSPLGQGPGAVDTVIDGFSLLSCGDPDRLCDRYTPPFRDGLHFGPAGHQVLGEAVYEQALSDCL